MTPLTLTLILILCAVTICLGIYAMAIMPKRLGERKKESLKVFSTAIELRFPRHAGLTERVVTLSEAVAASMELPAGNRYRLSLAARMRDIGLCAVPWKLINEKSPFQWTPAERNTFERHAEIGGAMLELVPSLRGIAPIVRNHRAPFDGSAGPTFPKGKDIPVEARILSVVDAFVTMERHQGSLLARDHLGAQAGLRFDPQVVETLLKVLTSGGVATADFPANAPASIGHPVSAVPQHQDDWDQLGSSDN